MEGGERVASQRGVRKKKEVTSPSQARAWFEGDKVQYLNDQLGWLKATFYEKNPDGTYKVWNIEKGLCLGSWEKLTIRTKPGH